jgi:hypothetical protein
MRSLASTKPMHTGGHTWSAVKTKAQPPHLPALKPGRILSLLLH